jgi:uncharacterized protein (DUF2147 family)
MFCRFRGINERKYVSHMRSFVMHKATAFTRQCAVALAAVAGTVFSAAQATAAPTPKEAGVWFDDTGKGAVKIELCGTKLCGRIVWLKSLVNDKGEPLVDRHNPDAALKTRPICGLQIIGQLDAVPDGGFDNGWIYDPKEGKSYSVAITLNNADELSVTGYKGVKFLSKTFIWKRAKTELPSCDAAPIEAKIDGGAVPAKAGAGAASAATGAATAVKPPSVAAPTPARAAPTVQAAPAKPAATKPASAAAGAEALPWAKSTAPAPAAKPVPQGASNLGAAAIKTPTTAQAKKPVVKATATKPASTAKPPVKSKEIVPATAAKASTKPAVAAPQY